MTTPKKPNYADLSIMLLQAQLDGEAAANAKYNLANRNEFTRGVMRGVDQMQATYQGGMGMIESLSGNPLAADERFSKYQDEMRQSSENPATVDQFFSSDPEKGAMAGPGNMATWAAGSVGAALPSVAESIGMGIAGAAAGSMVVPGPDPTDVAAAPVGFLGGLLGKQGIKQAIAKTAAEYVKRGIASDVAESMATKAIGNTLARRAGAAIGTSQATALHEGGGMWSEGMEQGYDNPVSALLLGQVSGVSEATLGAVPSGLRMLAKKTNVSEIAKQSGMRAAAGYLWDAAKNAGEEGVQESFQEFLGSVNERINDPDKKILTRENFMKWAEAGAAGAVVGGMFGAGEASQSAYRDLQNTRQRPADTTSVDMSPEDKAKEDEIRNKIASFDKPPGKHDWAEIINGDREDQTGVPSRAERKQKWEQARADVAASQSQLEAIPPQDVVQPEQETQDAVRPESQPQGGEIQTETPVPAVEAEVQDEEKAKTRLAEEIARRRGLKKPPEEQSAPATTDSGTMPPQSATDDEDILDKYAKASHEDGVKRGLYKSEFTEKTRKSTLESLDNLANSAIKNNRSTAFASENSDLDELRTKALQKIVRDKGYDVGEVTRSKEKGVEYIGFDVLGKSAPSTPTTETATSDRTPDKPTEPTFDDPNDKQEYDKIRQKLANFQSVPRPDQWADAVLGDKSLSLKAPSDEDRKKQWEDAIKAFPVITVDRQFGKPVSKDLLEVRNDFVSKAKEGVEFTHSGYAGSVFKVLEGGDILETTSARKMGNVRSMANSLKAGQVTWKDTKSAETFSVPMPKNYEEIEALPKYSIYGRDDLKGKMTYQVRGDGKRGGGDTIHDTLKDAQEYADLEKRRDEERKVADERRVEQEKADQKKKEGYEASFGGFLSSDPKTKGRQLKILGSNRRVGGKLLTVKEIIEKDVSEGAIVDDNNRLITPDQTFRDSTQLTKIGIDYARHLIRSKSTDTVSADNTQSQEVKDAPQTKKGGDPNEVQAEGRQRQTQAEADAEREVNPESKDQATGETPSPDSSMEGKPKPPKGYKRLAEFTPDFIETKSPDLELQDNRDGIKELGLKQGEAVGYRVYPKRGSSKGAYWQYGTVRYEPSGSHASVQLEDGTVEVVGGSRLVRLEPTDEQSQGTDKEQNQGNQEVAPTSPRSGENQGLTEGFRSLPAKGRAAFETEWNKGTDSIKNILYPDNKNYRAEFEARTGIKLPKTVKGTFETVERWNSDGRKLAADRIDRLRSDAAKATLRGDTEMADALNKQADQLQGKPADSQTKPRKVVKAFHGGVDFIQSLDESKMESRDPGRFGKGFYFTDRKGGAQQYGDVAAGKPDAGRVTEVEIDTSNYLEATPKDLRDKYGDISSQELTAAVKKDGYDGLSVRMSSGGIEYVAFSKDTVSIKTNGLADAMSSMHYPDGSAYREWMIRKHRAGDHPTSFLSGHSSGVVRDAAKKNPGLGLVITPANPGYVNHSGDYSHIMIDNGAFSEFTGNAPFSEDRFFALLDKVVEAGLKDKVQHVVVPDKVGDWKGTNERWNQFYERVRSYGMPLAYVGQDGIEQNMDQIPWDQFDVFFIGGSTPWKLGFNTKAEYKDFNRPTDDELRSAKSSREFNNLLKEAKRRGKKIHMGRVNSFKRMEIAGYGMQVDSVDGNYIGAGPEKNLPKVLGWLESFGGDEFKSPEIASSQQDINAIKEAIDSEIGGQMQWESEENFASEVIPLNPGTDYDVELFPKGARVYGARYGLLDSESDWGITYAFIGKDGVEFLEAETFVLGETPDRSETQYSEWVLRLPGLNEKQARLESKPTDTMSAEPEQSQEDAALEAMIRSEFEKQMAAENKPAPKQKPEVKNDPVEYVELKKGNDKAGVSRTIKASRDGKILMIEESKKWKTWSVRELEKSNNLAEDIDDLRKAKKVAEKVFDGVFDKDADKVIVKNDNSNLAIPLDKLADNWSISTVQRMAGALKETGIYSDGRFAVQVSDKDRDTILKKANQQDAEPSFISKTLNKLYEDGKDLARYRLNELAIAGYRGGELEERQILLKNGNDGVVILDKRYHDTVMKRHPSAKMWSDAERYKASNAPVSYTVDGEVVAVVMVMEQERIDKNLAALMDGTYVFPEQEEQQSKPKKKMGKKADSKTKLESAAEKARSEVDDLWKELNDLGRTELSSGLNPKLAALAVKIAIAEIKADTLTFAAFVERSVAKIAPDILEKLKPYMEKAWEVAYSMDMTKDRGGKFDDYLQKSNQYGTAENPSRVALGKHFASRLKDGASYVRITDARKEAADLIGGTPKDGTQAIKTIDEAIELGVVMVARDIAQSEQSDEQIYDQLVDLYERQPNLGARTSTSMLNQAYSTPAPLAFLVNRQAGIGKDDTVYDSSAGNGMLLIAGGERIANELNSDRVEALRAQGIETTSNDATEFDLEKPITALAINPPFGEIKNPDGSLKQWTVDGVNTDKVDHAITIKSLEEIPDDGKVAIIIGAKGFEQRKAKDDSRRGKAYLNGKAFYDHVYDNYNVTDHYTAHGDLYSRQGASFPVDVIIIEGRGKSSRPKPYNIVGGGIPQVFSSWEDLKNVKLLGNIRPSKSGDGRGSVGTEQGVVSEKVGVDAQQGSDGIREGTGGTVQQDIRNVGRPGKSQKMGRLDQDANVPGQAESIVGGNQQQGNQGRGDEPQSGSDAGGNDSRVSGGTKNRNEGRDKLKAVDAVPSEESEVKGDQYQSGYTPSSKSKSVDALIPNNHQTAVQSALDTVEEQYGDIDDFVANELGIDRDRLYKGFSAEQVDALALAIARHKDGRAFILGDQTGVGKGRVAAGMLIYAKKQGLAPVFVTEKPTLYADIVRDLIDTGFSTDDSPFNPLMTNVTSKKSDQIELPDGRVLKQTDTTAQRRIAEVVDSFISGNGLVATSKKATKNREAETETYDAIFTTYDQMATINGELKARHISLQKLSPKAFYILDESHNAGGSAQDSDREKPQKSDDNKIPVSQMVRDLIESASGVYFSSATYAKRSSVMDLYAKTGMTAATGQDGDSLAAAIAAGGVPLQQVVSQQLVESGAYLRRERSFDGVEFKPVVYDVDTTGAEQSASIFRAINAFDKIKGRLVEEEMEDGVTSAGGSIKPDWATGEAGMTSTNFSSILWNLTDQMLLAVKSDVIADEAIASLKRGESPVIYVDSTMESALNAYIESSGLQPGDLSDFSFRDLLQRYLDRSREVLVQRDVEDSKSYEQVRLTDEQLGEAGLAAFNAAQELIDSFDAKLPASPIDWIRKRIEDAGYSFGEYTGRQMVMRYQTADTVTVEKRPESEVGAANRINLIRQFNNGDLDVLLFNQSGSTGISMHASEKVKNKKPRHMIIGQPSKNIDTFMQSLGRVHRTGQVTLPKFTLAMTNLPAEIRPASVLVKKLASLNANVTASDKGSVSFDVPDVMNVIGDRIIAEYLVENDELNRALNEGEEEGLVVTGRTGQPKVVPGIARKASGRLALMPIKTQQEFWDSVTETFTDTIAELDRMGANPLSARVADLDAKTLESFPVFDGDPESANVFERPAYVEKVIAKRPGKPMTPEEIMQKVTGFYKLDVSAGADAIAKSREAWEQERRAEAIASVEKRIEDIRSEGEKKGTKPERIDASIDKEKQQRSNFLYLIRSFAPGTSVSVWEGGPTESLDIIPGVVLSVERKGKDGNPISLSKWRVEIAIGSPDRVIRMSLSQLRVAADQNDNSGRAGRDDDADETDSVKIFSNSDMVSESVLSDFKESEVSTMETRYIGTGNILAAFNLFKEQKGRVTFFRDSDGNLQRGVLLPRRFKIDKWLNDQPVSFDDADQIQRFLASGNFLQTPDRALNVMSVRGGLVVRAPKSKSRGGKYTLNAGILRAASPQEFVSIGSRMEMVIDDQAKQNEVLKAILDVSGLQATTDKSLARQIKAEKSSKVDDGLSNKVRDLPNTLMQTESDDVNESALSTALDIALAAEDIGIQTFDKLVAFSVKTIGEAKTREVGAYLRLAAEQIGMQGIRKTGDVLGDPNVTREQAVKLAKAAFPMLSDEQIEAGVALIDRLGLLAKIGFAPAGTPVPSLPRSTDAVVRDGEASKSERVKGWTQFISATRAIVGATNKADVSTFIHEIAHPMRRFIFDRNVSRDQRFGITDSEIDALEKVLGVENGEWKTVHEEKFAKMWEQYWFEGRKSVDKKLDSLFEKISAWMQNVYKTIRSITGKQLPKEVDELFDKLVRRGAEPVDNRSVAEKGWSSIRNAVAEEIRELRGMPAIADVASQTQKQWLDTASEMMDADPFLGDRLVKEINRSPRNLDNVEVAVMQIYYRHVLNTFNEASEKLEAAHNKGDAAGKAAALAEADMISNSLGEIEDAAKKAGREWGRAGVARQIVLAKDFSLIGLRRKARVANAGNPLNAVQSKQIEEMAVEIANLQDKLAKAEQAKLDAERERNVQHEIDEHKKNAPPPGFKSKVRQKAVDKLNAFKNKFASVFGKGSESGPLYATEDEQMAEDAKEIVQAYVDLGVYSFGEFMANVRKDLGGEIPPQVEAAFSMAWEDAVIAGDIPVPSVDKDDVGALSRLAREIARGLVEAGITDRDEVVNGVYQTLKEIVPEITIRETMDAISGYGQYFALSTDQVDVTLRDIKGQLQQLAKLDDMRSGVAPSKTGVERREVSDEERRLIAEVNEAKRRGGFKITDPASQLKTMLGAAKTAVRNRIKDLQYEIDNRQKIVRDKTELVPDQQLIDLQKKKAELMAIHKELFPKPEATMEQRVAAANRALDRVIADLERQIQSGNVTTAKKSERLSTPELEAKRARIDALRAQKESILDLQNPNRKDEQSEKAYKANLLNRLADYQERIANKDFQPRPKKQPRVLTKEELDLKRQLKETKDKFFRLARDFRLSHMSPAEKAWDYAKETAHLSRSVMTSFDLSAVFRQGGTASFSHPKLAKEAAREMLGAMMSEKSEFETAERIRQDDMYQFAMTAGLDITEEDGAITRQEEAFAGRWAREGIGKEGTKLNETSRKLLTPVSASARAYITFLNGMRFRLFKHMVENLGKGGQVTADEAKVIANFINVSTGRSNLGPAMKWAESLNTVFFAPRYVLSRFQYLGMPLWLMADKNVSGRVKKAIAMEYIRHATGVASFLTLAVALGSLMGGDDEEKPTVELDPRSSDFMKLKIGETRIDPMSGFSQAIVLMSRVVSGQRKTTSGEIADLRGPNVKYGQSGTADVLANFLRSKLAPIPGTAVDIVSGENVVGQPETPIGAVASLFVPLSGQELFDTMRARGIPQGTAITMLALLGMGASTYGPQTEFAKADEAKRIELIGKEGTIEGLKDSGVSFEEARRLLIKNWEEKHGSAREVVKGVIRYKEGLSNRLKELRKAYAQ